MPHVWTVEEIHALPEFGAQAGWFYGFARVEGRLCFGEILPGFGVAVCWPFPVWHPRTWWRVVRDVLFYRP